MVNITKKRLKAILIDQSIYAAVYLGAEYFLRKKIKNEAFHTLVTPMVTQYSLEFAQLKASGQTIGYKVMGLKLATEDTSELTSKQILKRIAYRDTLSTVDYFRDRKGFEKSEGAILPHDKASGTIVREIEGKSICSKRD